MKDIGEWRNDKATGRFVSVGRNGYWGAGEVRDGTQDGWSVIYDPKGTVYAGQMKAGKLHGKGIYVHADGKMAKSTEWRDHKGI